MINIYSDSSKIKGDYRIVDDNSATFDINVAPNDLDETDIQLLKEIEGISKVYPDGVCKGKYGVCNIDNISTGMKTLLNVRHILKSGRKDTAVDITEAGQNVMEHILNTVDNTGLKVVLGHTDVEDCTDHEYLLDEKYRLKNNDELFYKLINTVGSDECA